MTIDERMQRVHECILAERGFQVETLVLDDKDEVDLPDWNGSSWRNFDKWNDAPIFAMKRRKAEAR